jgi:hypothetical protein
LLAFFVSRQPLLAVSYLQEQQQKHLIRPKSRRKHNNKNNHSPICAVVDAVVTGLDACCFGCKTRLSDGNGCFCLACWVAGWLLAGAAVVAIGTGVGGARICNEQLYFTVTSLSN